ncbi:MAG: energy-coupling factor transporter ATPase [Desulfotomaculaceae bacterium]|nr:energy-coupling factor transporter ATPase [Desulfotomaculaceae bacterium]
MPLYKIENLTYYYPEAEKAVLKNICLEIEDGEFILVAGGSGSGKSSVARVLAGLIPDFYGGRIGGEVYFQGQDIRAMDRRKLARQVGMVFQDPEKQIVQTHVEAEIAFGLENLGLDNEEMLRRVAEVICFMDLEQIRGDFTANLSGGQKQKLALASVLAMQPHVLVLDEPTSQLDPVAAEDILNLVKRLNEEMGFTVVMIEQRLERCYHLADRVLLMDQGRIACDGSAREVARKTIKGCAPFLPPVARFFAGLQAPTVPLTVKEGRKLLRSCLNIKETGAALPAPGAGDACPADLTGRSGAVRQKNLWFTYPGGQEVLKDVSLDIREGEFVAVLGENGAGKSTMLRQLTGLLRPDRGTVEVFGQDVGKNGFKEIRKHIAYLSQNPNDYLFQDTVEDELLFTLKNFGLKDTSAADEMLERFNLAQYRRTNPRDLSSGERQRVALASVLVTSPCLIILDEPTRGVDFRLKAELGRFLQQEAEKGRTVIVVTHDVEFAAEYAARVVMMFSGRVVSDGPKHDVLGKSVFYSPQLGKMCRGICNGVLTFSEARDRIYPLVAGGAAAGEDPGVM